ncbi:MAG: response regulator transcription factor [Lachnospiraceae bacterium]|nr:response regulator transcription factor [Lachnospiraceae bacterium]
MILIGICDDEKVHRKQIMDLCDQYFEAFPKEHEYIEFSSGEEVLSYQGERLLLLFLDIEMGETSGLSVLEQLRDSDQVWRIAFASSHKEQRFDTIDMKTLAFLEKPIQYAGVEKCLNIAIREQEKNSLVTFTKLEGRASVELGDIVYIQAEKHYVNVFVKREGFVGYDSIKDCEKQLQGTTMIRIHKSYLVNMVHIRKFGSGEVLMTDGSRLPIGRKYSLTVKEQYQNFVKSVTVGRNGA